MLDNGLRLRRAIGQMNDQQKRIKRNGEGGQNTGLSRVSSLAAAVTNSTIMRPLQP